MTKSNPNATSCRLCRLDYEVVIIQQTLVMVLFLSFPSSSLGMRLRQKRLFRYFRKSSFFDSKQSF